MAGVLRTSENDLRRSWAVYISGSTESNQCIGMVALLPGTRIPGDEERTATSGVWELGFLYRPESWGKGYATESCAAGIDSLRQDLDGAGQHPDIAKIVAQVHPGNEGSLKVCRKLGFKEVERRNYGGEKKFLSGQWRDNEVVVFEKEI
jgi:RimJ/RimL family protein N-acetyltransferase